jgi:hypothetical protein
MLKFSLMGSGDGVKVDGLPIPSVEFMQSTKSFRLAGYTMSALPPWLAVGGCCEHDHTVVRGVIDSVLDLWYPSLEAKRHRDHINFPFVSSPSDCLLNVSKLLIVQTSRLYLSYLLRIA